MFGENQMRLKMFLAVILSLLIFTAGGLQAQTSVFTYQVQLEDSSVHTTGKIDGNNIYTVKIINESDKPMPIVLSRTGRSS